MVERTAMSPEEIERLLALDREHVWHPYGPMPGAVDNHLVVAAEGVRLELADGRTLIDGMSSWWAAVHGYRHPVLDAAVADQIGRMSHVMFGGLTHPPAVRLASLLLDLTPEPLTKIFFADSGSVSVEVAIKMALQYQRSLGRPERHRLLTVRGGYHGDTFGDMSVCDPVNGMHQLFTGVLPRQIFAPPPPGGYHTDPDPAYLDELAALAARHSEEIAAIIAEPVVQGAGGMRFYSPAYLRALRELADEHNVPLILDEIATGFGRSGTFWGADHAGVVPDIMCIGKALTGGYLTMAATLCTTEIAQVISQGEGGGLMHGPTFMANPLAATVACASIELLTGRDGRGRDWRAEVSTIEENLREGLAETRGLPGVRDTRVLGAIGVIETVEPVDVPAIQKILMEHGVWLRPFRNLIYTMPPYVCAPAEIRQITEAMVAAARSL